MRIRDFVEALRRKPGQEGSQSPRRNEDDELPLVEVADVVAEGRERSFAPASGTVVQTLMGGVPTPAKSPSRPTPPPPGDVTPFVPRPPENLAGPSDPLDLADPVALSPPASFPEFDLGTLVEHNAPPPAAPPMPDPLADLVSFGQAPPPPPVRPPMPPTDATVKLPPPPLPEGFSLPPPPATMPLSSPPPGGPQPATIPLPSLPPPVASPTAPPPGSWFTPVPTPPPLGRDTQSTGLASLFDSSSQIPVFKAPPTEAKTAPSSDIPRTDSISVEPLRKAAAFALESVEFQSREELFERLTQTACEVLGATRAFAVFLDDAGLPMPITIEHFGPNRGNSLQGVMLGPSFSEKLADHAALFEKSVVVELATGLSLVPADFFAPTEWYLLPSGTPAPLRTVIGVQWATQPESWRRPVADLLTQSAKTAFRRISEDKSLRGTPSGLFAVPTITDEPLQATPSPVDSSEPPGVLPSVVAEQMLRQIDEAILVCDAGGQLRFGNQMAEFLTGCFDGELSRCSLDEIAFGPGRANDHLWLQLARTTEDQQFDAEISTIDGSLMSVSVSCLTLPVFDSPNAQPLSGARIIVLRDVTRSRNEVAAVLQNELDWFRGEVARLQDLAAMPPPAPVPVSPSIPPEQIAAMRSSLMMVLGFSELLHRGEYGPMNSQQFETFRNIEHHANQMATILNTLFPLES